MKNLIKIISILYLSLLMMNCGLFGDNSNNTPTNSSSKILEKIEIAPLLTTLVQGIQFQLSATAFYQDGSKQDVSKIANWRSGDKKISTIDEQGLLTTISPGAQSITVTYNETSANINITIGSAVLKALNINPVNPSIAKNTTINLSVIGIFDNGSRLNVTNQVTWNIENKAILSETILSETMSTKK